MKKKEKLPGDIAHIIKQVGKSTVAVKMLNGIDEINLTLTRDQYNVLMKCELVDVPTLQGFYLVDRDAKRAKLIKSHFITKGISHVMINGVRFGVNIPTPGVIYGK